MGLVLYLLLGIYLEMELLFTNDSHLTIRSSALALSSFAVGFAAFPGTSIAESTAASTERAGSRSSVQSTESIAGSTKGSTETTVYGTGDSVIGAASTASAIGGVGG
uniref:Uncharacterized protein n=1 Tax=Picea glauca TaxID=3330 RepID=A0A101M445_PICGL|nr:hypothetical protein ABT39_MTgene438 [Picea glauca]QHR88206.1 hypothetical protein Q903MT_gene2219 [Picea sitchensis]